MGPQKMREHARKRAQVAQKGRVGGRESGDSLMNLDPKVEVSFECWPNRTPDLPPTHRPARGHSEKP